MCDFSSKKNRIFPKIKEFKAHLKNDLDEMHLIISPHFDDAVISMGGFLTSSLSEQIYIVTVFGGRPKIPFSSKWDSKCGFKNSDEAILKRREEEKKAFSFLDIPKSNYLNFNYFERQHRDKLKEKYYSEEELRFKIKSDLISFLSKNKKKKCFIYVPAVPSHIDHKIITNAVVSIASDPDNFFICFYQDMPYTSNLISKNDNDFFVPQKELEKRFNLSVIPMYIRVRSGEGRKKKKAIKLYCSQYSKLKSHLRRANKTIKKQLKFFGIQEKSSEIIYLLSRIHE